MTRLLLCREDLDELARLLKSNTGAHLHRPTDVASYFDEWPTCCACDGEVVGRAWVCSGGFNGDDYNDDRIHCEHCIVDEAICNSEFNVDPVSLRAYADPALSASLRAAFDRLGVVYSPRSVRSSRPV